MVQNFTNTSIPQLSDFGIIDSEFCFFCLEQSETLFRFFFFFRIVNFLIASGMMLQIRFPQNYKSTINDELIGFQENCIDYKFFNKLMLVARFFIYRWKYYETKTNMLKYFWLFNMIKKSKYILVKRNKNIDKHCKKW